MVARFSLDAGMGKMPSQEVKDQTHHGIKETLLFLSSRFLQPRSVSALLLLEHQAAQHLPRPELRQWGGLQQGQGKRAADSSLHGGAVQPLLGPPDQQALPCQGGLRVTAVCAILLLILMHRTLTATGAILNTTTTRIGSTIVRAKMCLYLFIISWLYPQH